MTSTEFHHRLQFLINTIEEGEISYEEYTERYVALLEQSFAGAPPARYADWFEREGEH